MLEQSEYEQENLDFAISQELDLRPRMISPERMQRFEEYISEIFEAFGLDVHMPATEETPRRFLQALFEATEGYDGDPKLIKVFQAEYRGRPDGRPGQVIEGPIPFYALCEHHGFPFVGRAYIGYIPDEHILGISKLTRMVRLFAKRFSVQERLGEQVASALEQVLAPRGVAVYLTAHHLCMAMRGVREDTSVTHTTAWRGDYANESTLRSEFLLMCKSNTPDRGDAFC